VAILRRSVLQSRCFNPSGAIPKQHESVAVQRLLRNHKEWLKFLYGQNYVLNRQVFFRRPRKLFDVWLFHCSLRHTRRVHAQSPGVSGNRAAPREFDQGRLRDLLIQVIFL
jgi:hypothetical protein